MFLFCTISQHLRKFYPGIFYFWSHLQKNCPTKIPHYTVFGRYIWGQKCYAVALCLKCVHLMMLLIGSQGLGSGWAYALTFTGLNFRGFRGSIASREGFIPRKFRPDRQRLCNYVTNRENKNAKTAKIGNPRKLKRIRYTTIGVQSLEWW